MVCVPCIVIPVLLYIWHRWLYPGPYVMLLWQTNQMLCHCGKSTRWLQPIALKIWNPWAKVFLNFTLMCRCFWTVSSGQTWFVTFPCKSLTCSHEPLKVVGLSGGECQRRRGRQFFFFHSSTRQLSFHWYQTSYSQERRQSFSPQAKLQMLPPPPPTPPHALLGALESPWRMVTL